MTLSPSPQPPPYAIPADAALHPWRRYWARMFNLFLVLVIGSVVLQRILPAVLPGLWTLDVRDPRTLLAFAAWVPVETLCLVLFGTTPGKALYGIRLARPQGVTLLAALSRSAKVWFRGLGMAIPLVSIFTLVAAYERLVRDGRTSWDADAGWTVTHATLGTGRWIAIGLCWVLVAAMIEAAGMFGA
ncbi:MAG: RDD family protein [Pseudomonadota bacterium]